MKQRRLHEEEAEEIGKAKKGVARGGGARRGEEGKEDMITPVGSEEKSELAHTPAQASSSTSSSSSSSSTRTHRHTQQDT